jgi:dynein heavy chain, axonemal
LKTEADGKTKIDILRYYYYIQHGFDTSNVAPLEESWLDEIFNHVPDILKYKQYEKELRNLNETIREDYLLSVKKAIVDFVLKDNRQDS